MIFRICFMVLLVISPAIQASDSSKVATSSFLGALNEAEDYLTVHPARSMQILERVNITDSLPAEHVIRWHLLYMRASLFTNKLKNLASSLDAVFVYRNEAYFKAHITTVMSAAGILLRKLHYLPLAKSSFECAYKHATSDRQRLTLTNSLALLARQSRNYEEATALYLKARPLAISGDHTNIKAIIDNNLGMLAFDRGRFEEAEHHYREALKGYQEIDKRTGRITAGINLLFSFVMQNKWMDYQRLYRPTANLTYAFPNEAKQSLLKLIHQEYLRQQGEDINTLKQAQLESAFNTLEGDMVKRHIVRYLAKGFKLALKEPVVTIKEGYEKEWVRFIERCEWS